MLPGEQPLYLVTPTESPQRTPALGRGLFSAASVGRDHFNPGRRQLFVQRVAVERLVDKQPLRELVDEAFEESVCDKGDFMRRIRRCVYGERKTSAVGPPPRASSLCPAWSFPLRIPFFSDDERPVDKAFIEVEVAARPEIY
jgi:hypothetical protein